MNSPKNLIFYNLYYIAAATKGTQLKQKGHTAVYSSDDENNHLKGKEIFNDKGVSGSPEPDWIA